MSFNLTLASSTNFSWSATSSFSLTLYCPNFWLMTSISFYFVFISCFIWVICSFLLVMVISLTSIDWLELLLSFDSSFYSYLLWLRVFFYNWSFNSWFLASRMLVFCLWTLSSDSYDLNLCSIVKESVYILLCCCSMVSFLCYIDTISLFRALTSTLCLSTSECRLLFLFSNSCIYYFCWVICYS